VGSNSNLGSRPEQQQTFAALTFVLPESFNAAEFLKTAKLKPLHDDARYFISTILVKTARGQVDILGVVRLHAAHLRRVMHNRHYRTVVEALLERGAIERFPYAVGERSFGYRLTKRFVADRHVRVRVTDCRLIARLKAFHARAEVERQSRLEPVHRALARQQKRLRIDGDRARQIIAGLPEQSNPWDAQGILVADIEQRDFHVNVGRYGRLSNNVTSMKREIRTALHCNGSPLASVDVSCAQPALIAKIMRDQIQNNKGQIKDQTEQSGRRQEQTNRGTIYDAPNNLPKLPSCDFTLYEQLAQTGQLYDYLLAELRRVRVNMPRDVLKRRFLCDVVAKRKANQKGAEYPSVVEDVFRGLFPSVYAFVRKFNYHGWRHENLIRELQIDESKLVIETVAADLVRMHPTTFFLTLHDAIYSAPHDLAKVEDAFRQAFDRTGFQMTIKRSA
jgi:hypothetical protein